MSLEQFLVSVRRYQNGERVDNLNKIPSILTEFLGTEVSEPGVKQLCAA